MKKSIEIFLISLSVIVAGIAVYAAYHFTFIEFPTNRITCKLQGGEWVTYKQFNFPTSMCRFLQIDPPNVAGWDAGRN
jgi:hypothetical protein